jgi:hypothetical protein
MAWRFDGAADVRRSVQGIAAQVSEKRHSNSLASADSQACASYCMTLTRQIAAKRRTYPDHSPQTLEPLSFLQVQPPKQSLSKLQEPAIAQVVCGLGEVAQQRGILHSALLKSSTMHYPGVMISTQSILDMPQAHSHA